MRYQVACDCGKVHLIAAGLAGTSIKCDCGVEVPVPSLLALRGVATENPAPSQPMNTPAPPTELPAAEPVPEPKPYEIVRPTRASIQFARQLRSSPVMASLSADAIWIQDAWRTRKLPLKNLQIENRRSGFELTVTNEADSPTEKITLTLGNATDASRWFEELAALSKDPIDESTSSEQHVAEGISLVRHPPAAHYDRLGRISFMGATEQAATGGLQLRAAMRGADAVIDVYIEKAPNIGRAARRASGVAVRVGDDYVRHCLRMYWHDERTRAIANRMLLLTLAMAILLFASSVFCAGKTSLNAASGETPAQAAASSAVWMGLIFAWPLVLLVAVRISLSLRLLRVAGLAVLAATTGRSLVIMGVYAIAAFTSDSRPPREAIWVFIDPLEWALIILGLVYFKRAWKLAGEGMRMRRDQSSAAPAPPTNWSRILLVITTGYTLALLGFTGFVGYELASYLFQPGIDPKVEQKALVAFNEGLTYAKSGDLTAAEYSYKESLQFWEQLTAKPNAPPNYRIGLAITLYNLALIRHQRDKIDDAETYYARVVKIGDELGGAGDQDAEYHRMLADSRRILTEFREFKSNSALDEKNKKALQLYDAANVKGRKGEAAAEGMYLEAIALWDEVLAQATNEQYRKERIATVAYIYMELAELQDVLGKLREAEDSVKKAIERGEAALKLGPDRPLMVKDNLERSRQMLDRLRERVHQQELDKLFAEKRFADAEEHYLRGIKECEDWVRTDKDREAATRMLANRLERFAVFLAHCPDARIRDTKAAVRQARRATELQPTVGDLWYTLALVEYRNGEWRASMESLAQVKSKEGDLDGSSLFLSAMNQHQLKQFADAKATYRKAMNWIEDRKKQAESNPSLRIQFELMRPGLDALRREAENLLEGKDPSGDKVG